MRNARVKRGVPAGEASYYSDLLQWKEPRWPHRQLKLKGDIMSVSFTRTIPILRIFNVDKAREFYIDWLGFKIDWEHQSAKNTPQYIQVSRGNLVLHLSENHGDACPGSTVCVEMRGIEEFHREILAKDYKYNRPGLEQTPWKTKCSEVIDPFGNRIRFNEHAAT